MKECRKVAAGLGKLTRFYSRGREMSRRDLENCNRADLPVTVRSGRRCQGIRGRRGCR